MDRGSAETIQLPSTVAPASRLDVAASVTRPMRTPLSAPTVSAAAQRRDQTVCSDGVVKNAVATRPVSTVTGTASWYTPAESSPPRMTLYR